MVSFAEHQNWFGMDEQLGPVAISIKREKVIHPENQLTTTLTQYQYRWVYMFLRVLQTFSNTFEWVLWVLNKYQMLYLNFIHERPSCRYVFTFFLILKHFVYIERGVFSNGYIINLLRMFNVCFIQVLFWGTF